MQHIAIMRQPFFDMVISGEKSIESRWSQSRRAPYNRVKVGDEILFKLTGQPVTATAKVAHVRYYELTPELVDDIRLRYGKEIGTDRFDDWEGTRNKKYCTLIWLCDVKKTKPIEVPRSNGAGWIVLE